VAVTLLVRLQARPGAEERLAAVLSEVAEASRAEPGCGAFLAHRSPEDGSAFLLYERWADEAAMQLHRATEHFARAIAEFPALLVGERTREVWTPLD